jgi:hypothetical protein
MRKRRGQHEPERTRLTLLDRLIIPLVTALVAFGASYLAALTGSQGAAENQRVALEEQRKKDDRDKRAEVYMAYLDAVGDYAAIFHAAVACFRESAKSAAANELPQKCQDAMVADPKPLKQLKQSLNKLTVFGTPDVVGNATKPHRAILVFEENETTASNPPVGDPQVPVAVGPPVPAPTQQMPTAAPSAPVPKTATESATKFDNDYRDAYQDFVKSMCADLSADPRTRCSF